MRKPVLTTSDKFEIGEVVRDSERYIVTDLESLEFLTLSKTVLHPGQETTGHFHDQVDEIYMFVGGRGRLVVDDQVFHVTEKDIVTIPHGSFHKVYNDSDTDPLEFVCVFQHYNR